MGDPARCRYRPGTQQKRPGLVEARVFFAFAILLIASLPLIALVPDHRGNW